MIGVMLSLRDTTGPIRASRGESRGVRGAAPTHRTPVGGGQTDRFA